jgi:hypothetical protein
MQSSSAEPGIIIDGTPATWQYTVSIEFSHVRDGLRLK